MSRALDVINWQLVTSGWLVHSKFGHGLQRTRERK